MSPEMVRRNPPTSLSAIIEFECAHGLKLPASYKLFLLETNGGIPRNSNFTIVTRPSNPDENVQNFLGIGVPGIPTSELSYPIDLYHGGIPDGLLPIANQDFGSYICLDLRDGTDRVAFWDKSHFWSTGEWREVDLYHVADSFEAFLALLGPAPKS